MVFVLNVSNQSLKRKSFRIALEYPNLKELNLSNKLLTQLSELPTFFSVF